MAMFICSIQIQISLTHIFSIKERIEYLVVCRCDCRFKRLVRESNDLTSNALKCLVTSPLKPTGHQACESSPIIHVVVLNSIFVHAK